VYNFSCDLAQTCILPQGLHGVFSILSISGSTSEGRGLIGLLPPTEMNVFLCL